MHTEEEAVGVTLSIGIPSSSETNRLTNDVFPTPSLPTITTFNEVVSEEDNKAFDGFWVAEIVAGGMNEESGDIFAS